MVNSKNNSPLQEKKIEVIDFHKSFGHKKVHHGVHFNVYKGECLGLIGGSGSGKSVICRSLIGLEKPDHGSVLIDGEDITKLNEIDLIRIRKKVAYAFQGGALFDSMTVFQNLSYPLIEHTNLNDQQIKDKVMLQLHDFGLDQSENVYPSRLSGGMQKRVGLARAMMLEPEVILYDEPTAGLDPYNTKKIQETILHLKKRGTTGILVTHDIATAFAVCDRLSYLYEGKILITQTMKQIQEDPNNPLQKFLQGEI